MPNHVHLMAGVTEGGNLSHVLRNFKKFTSVAIVKAVEQNLRESRRDWMLWIFRRHGTRNSNNTHYQFWQQDNHPIELNNNALLAQRLNYVHQNPVRAGICYTAADYLYSSAGQYGGGEAVLAVKLPA